MPDVFISFSRRADFTLVAELAEYVSEQQGDVGLVCSKVSNIDSVEAPAFEMVSVLNSEWADLTEADTEKLVIKYDSLVLRPNDSLDELATIIGNTKNIVFLLSEGFFQSYYCIEELRRAASKGSNCTPVIVFTKECKPEHICLEHIEHYWRETNADKISTRWVNSMLDDLPDFHSWLLGGQESNTSKFDTFFLAITDEGKSTLSTVYNELLNPRKPHFPLHPRNQFTEFYTKEIRICFKSIDETEKRNFADYIDHNYINSQTLESLLLQSQTPSDALNMLRGIRAYLDDARATDSLEKIDFYGGIRIVLSALLFSMVDFKKLQIQIHAINRRSDATVQVAHSNDLAWQSQFIIACVTKTLAIYKLRAGKVAGEGEMDRIESGSAFLDNKNREEAVQGWLNVLSELYGSFSVDGVSAYEQSPLVKSSDSKNDQLSRDPFRSQRTIDLEDRLQERFYDRKVRHFVPYSDELTPKFDKRLREFLLEEFEGLHIVKMDSNTHLIAHSLLTHDEKVSLTLSGFNENLTMILQRIEELTSMNRWIAKDS